MEPSADPRRVYCARFSNFLLSFLNVYFLVFSVYLLFTLAVLLSKLGTEQFDALHLVFSSLIVREIIHLLAVFVFFCSIWKESGRLMRAVSFACFISVK